MQCERHKALREMHKEMGLCYDCVYEAETEEWLLALNMSILRLTKQLADLTEFMRDSAKYNNWKRLEYLDKSLKGFIEYVGPRLYERDKKYKEYSLK